MILLSQARPFHRNQTFSSLYDPLVHDACGAPWATLCVQWQWHDSGLFLGPRYCTFSVGPNATCPKQPARLCSFWCKVKPVCPSIFPPRNLLLRFGHFGGDEFTTSMKLARAYKRFKEWISERKIECSQPPFSEKMEAWTMVFGSCFANGFCISSICFVSGRP